MARAARRDAQIAVNSPKPTSGKRQPGRGDAPRPSDDELAAFYADMVNFDRCLPAKTISNTPRDAMLTRGLVTIDRLRVRGVR